MSRLPLARHHDPYWDMDGKGARRQRMKRSLVRFVTWLLILAVVAVASLNFPSIDPEYVLHGDGRILMAGALLTLLAAAALLALVRVRRIAHE